MCLYCTIKYITVSPKGLAEGCLKWSDPASKKLRVSSMEKPPQSMLDLSATMLITLYAELVKPQVKIQSLTIQKRWKWLRLLKEKSLIQKSDS